MAATRPTDDSWWRSRMVVITVGLLALGIGFAVAVRFVKPAEPAPIDASALFTHSFNDTEGRPQAISQWKGGWLVVNFWATWCAPCVEEMPDLQRVQNEYIGRGVTIVGLAIDNATAVKRFRDELKLQLPLLIASAAGTDLARELGNASGALPYTVLVDPAGHVVRSKLGQVRAAELRVWLDS
ncbi:MAG: TlpA disulfide reductase family protein, partial [Burkholderiaceae bacterium]